LGLVVRGGGGFNHPGQVSTIMTQTGTASGTEQWAIARIRVFEQGK
jgi:hypothetical protein